jgi:hypothetical protein
MPIHPSCVLVVLTATPTQDETITTNLEARTLELILDLLSIPREVFNGRSLTTGATASNILALGKAMVLFPSSHILNYRSRLYTSALVDLVLPKTVY